jgi:hypothetical protein
MMAKNKLTRNELIAAVERVVISVKQLKEEIRNLGMATPVSECANSVQKRALERLRNTPRALECYDVIQFDYLTDALIELKDNRNEDEIREAKRRRSHHEY